MSEYERPMSKITYEAREALIQGVAEKLHDKIEMLDVSGSVWANLNSAEKEYYAAIVEWLLPDFQAALREMGDDTE